MKRAAVILAVLSIALWAAAQNSGQAAQQTSGNGPGGPAPGAPPPAKRPPQAKTQAEFDAWKVAAANTDPARRKRQPTISPPNSPTANCAAAL